MPNERNQRRPSSPQEEPTDHTLYEAMQSLGWVFPETPEDVEQAEKYLAENPVTLPKHLQDPSGVLGRPSKWEARKQILPSDPQTEDQLAQAAREGGEITEPIRQQMQKDREEAERIADEHQR